MNLFKNRPLALCLFCFIGGLLSFYITLREKIPFYYGLILPLLPLLFFFLFKKGRRRIALFCLLFLLLGSTVGGLHYRHAFKEFWEEEDDIQIIGDVHEILSEGKRTDTVLFHIIQLGEKEADVWIRLKLPAEESVTVKSRFSCRITEITPSSSYDIQKGIAGSAVTDKITPLVFSEGGISFLLSDFRDMLLRRLRSALPEKEGRLLGGLLLGDDKNIDGNVKLSFRRSGLSHILALSGMHLAMLTSFLLFLFEKLRLPHRATVILTLLFIWGYTALTGFSPSLLRAAVMLSVVELGTFIRRIPDVYTSLFLALSLISAFSIGAVFDIGLWLSFFATFGIQFLKDNRPERKSKSFLSSLGHHISFSLQLTLSASGFTVLLIALFFGELSLISPISNLLLAPFFNLLLIVAFLLLIFPFPFLGVPIAAFTDLLLQGVDVFAKIPHVFISISDPFSLFFILLFSLLLLSLVCLKIKKKKIIRPLFLGSFLGLFLTLTLLHVLSLRESVFLYQRYDENEYLLFKERGNVTVVDISNDIFAPAFFVYDLEESGITEIDTLILTHYDTHSAAYVEWFTAHTLCFRILLSLPETVEEAEYFFEVEEMASELGILTERMESGHFSSASLSLLFERISPTQGATHPALLISADFLGEKVAYTTSNGLLSLRSAEKIGAFCETDTLIMGAHPRRYVYYKDLDLSEIETVITAYEDAYPYVTFPKEGLIRSPYVFKIPLRGK